jgi:hypothetical protein
MKYTPCKYLPMQGVNSTASSECAYLMIAENPKHVVDNV